MKKRIPFLALALLLCLCVIAGIPSALAAGEFDGLSFNATAADGSADMVKWQQIEEKYYLFLPTCTDISALELHFGGQDVKLDGAVIQSGEKTDIFADKQDHTLTVGTDSYTVVAMQSANLPAVFITTESGSMDHVNASKSNKESGYILIVDDAGNTEYDDLLDQIKGRGNSTWTADKKPYNLKLENKADLFGLGKSKKWSLLANYVDHSLIRNSIAFDLAAEVGILSQDCTLTDVYFNGLYNGTYLITEKVDVEKTKVDIENLADANEEANPDIDVEECALAGDRSTNFGARKWVDIPNDPEDITGGYILEFDFPDRYQAEVSGFVTTRGQYVVVKEPEYATKAEVNYIADYFQAFEDALYSDTGYNSQGKHYSEYCDIDSLARQYLLQELTLNLDATITSFFFYKDSDLSDDSIMYCDPAWDFDSAFSNYADNRFGYNTNDPSIAYVKHTRIWMNWSLPSYLAQAYSKADVYDSIIRIWNEDFVPNLKILMNQDPTVTSANGRLKSITGYGQEVSASAQMNFTLWDVLGTERAGFADTGNTHEENIQYLQKYFHIHIPAMNVEYGRSVTQESWHDWIDATCTVPKTCSVCGITDATDLGHKWNDATCTAPKTCSVCTATEGTALGHRWNDATCTTPKTCSVCTATEGTTLGHKWTDATCTLPNTCSVCTATEGTALGHKWTDATCTTPKTCSVCTATEGTALGHKWNDATCTIPKTCSVCTATEGASLGHKWNDATCTAPKTCAVCNATDGNALGHSYVKGICTLCGGEDPAYIPPLEDLGIHRIAGATRYETAFQVANTLKQLLAVDKFSHIIVASGEEYADALSGSYLAAVKNAPILLVKGSTMASVKAYIQANLAPGGTVYILGGGNAVSYKMESGLEGFVVKRLAGADRYETNLQILAEAGVAGKDILICTGKAYADALSASATGLPILLVNGSLTGEQKALLAQSSGNLYIIGGENAVSAKTEKQLRACGNTSRLAGITRYHTTVLVAERFCAAPDQVMIACGDSYPDGLTGGVLAFRQKTPLLLTQPGWESHAAAYIRANSITQGYVLGGEKAVADQTARNTFSIQ